MNIQAIVNDSIQLSIDEAVSSSNSYVFISIISVILFITIVYNSFAIIFYEKAIVTDNQNPTPNKPHISKKNIYMYNIILYVVYIFTIFVFTNNYPFFKSILFPIIISLIFIISFYFIPLIICKLDVIMKNRIQTFLHNFFGKYFLKSKNNSSITEDIAEALHISKNKINEEKEIIENIEKLNLTNVSSIMTPRVSIIAIDINSSFHSLVSDFIDSGYSRIPIYSGSLDTIKGILYIKDILPYLHKQNSFRWQTLIRPAYFTPETKKIDDLLEEFQKLKIHIAIVIDEYGGTSGLVSLEDILEEILGEIHDEFDDDSELQYLKINDNTYICNGIISINDIIKILELPDNYFDTIKGEADSLAGLILEIKGDFPKLHEEIVFNNLIFKIEDEDERRIKKIKVILHEN